MTYNKMNVPGTVEVLSTVHVVQSDVPSTVDTQ